MATKLKTLSYPEDRSSEDSMIIFTPKAFKFAGDDMAKIINTVKGGDIKQIIKVVKKIGANTIKKNLNFTRENFETLLTDAIINSGSKDGGSKKLKIVLPMRQVILDLNHNWEQKDVWQGNAGSVGGATKVLGGAVARDLLNKAIGADGALGNIMNTALSTSGGYFIQPKRSTYSGTDPINITLTYNFSPQSPEEAMEIKKIIKSFQYLSTTQSGKKAYTDSFAFGKNPAIWKLSFVNGVPKNFTSNKNKDIFNKLMFSNKNNKGNVDTIENNDTKLNKSAKNVLPYMVLKQVNTNYGNSVDSYTSFPDGFPSIISMALTFSSYFSIQSAQVLFGYDSIDDILSEGE
jgi:Tail-tube assembly protein